MRSPSPPASLPPAEERHDGGRPRAAASTADWGHVSVALTRHEVVGSVEGTLLSPRHLLFVRAGAGWPASGLAAEARFDDAPRQSARLTAETMSLLPAGCPGWSRLVAHATVETCAIALDPLAIERLTDGAVDPARLAIAPRTAFEDPVLRGAAAALWREARAPDPLSRLAADGAVATIWAALARRHAPDRTRWLGSERAYAGGLGARRLRRVLAHVDEHLAQGISLAELAAVAGLSVPQFTRAFRASTGTSPARLVRGRRVERAKALLADPTRAIAEVALAAGFADQQHLTRRFREATGTTPAAFRAAIG